MATSQPRGIHNYGVTCYLNAAMQALAACPALVTHLHESQSILELPTERPRTELAKAFRQLVEGLSTGARDSAAPFQPSDLVKLCSEMSITLQQGGQQDAQEFLGALLDALHMQHKRPLIDPELIDLRAKTSSRWRECTGEEWKDEPQLAYEVLACLPDPLTPRAGGTRGSALRVRAAWAWSSPASPRPPVLSSAHSATAVAHTSCSWTLSRGRARAPDAVTH